MTAAVLERELTIQAAPPLSIAEGDTLIRMSASAEKAARVKGGNGLRTSRGWSYQGQID